MSPQPRTPQEVGALIRARRKQLRLRQSDIVEKTKLSIPTITRLENGSRLAGDATARAVAVALGWVDDAVSQLFAGADPDTLIRTEEPPLTAQQAVLEVRRVLVRSTFNEYELNIIENVIAMLIHQRNH